MLTRLLHAEDGCPDAFETRAALQALGREVEAFALATPEDFSSRCRSGPECLCVVVVSRFMVWSLGEDLQGALLRCDPDTLVVWVDGLAPRPEGAATYGSTEALLGLLLGRLGADPAEPARLCAAADDHLRPRFEPVVWSPPHLHSFDDRCLELFVEIAEVRAHLAAGTLQAFLEGEVAWMDSNAP